MQETVSAILSASSDQVALFIDFDGTLVDIAPSPDKVEIPPALPEKLRALHAALGGAVAIVTGRTIDAIESFLPDQEISISGGHGAERRHLGKRDAADPVLLADARIIACRVADTLAGQAGILVEPKPTGVAVHYRAAPEKATMARAALTRAIVGFNDFHAIEGKKVFEARPKWADKGSAIERLMQVKPFAGRMPVFIGDDITDEDGFATAQRLGGFGVRIGQGETRARFILPAIADFFEYLDALIARQSASTTRSAGAGTSQGSLTK